MLVSITSQWPLGYMNLECLVYPRCGSTGRKPGNSVQMWHASKPHGMSSRTYFSRRTGRKLGSRAVGQSTTDVHWRTLPRAVFFRNLFFETAASSRWRLRIVILGCVGALCANVAAMVDAAMKMSEQHLYSQHSLPFMTGNLNPVKSLSDPTIKPPGVPTSTSTSVISD